MPEGTNAYPLSRRRHSVSSACVEAGALPVRVVLLGCAVTLVLALLYSSSGGSASLQSSPSFNALSAFALGKELEVAKLYDDTSLLALRRQFRDKNVVVFKAYLLTKPKLNRLFKHALALLNRTDYHFAVLFDNTQGLAQSRVLESDDRFGLLDHQRFHMFNYTLYAVISEFPELIYYLYQATFKDKGNGNADIKGSCCRREDLWQILRAPIILWQNKKNFRFRYTWMIEDDFDALKNGESVLMDFIVALDRKYRRQHVDVLAFRQTPCPTFWHKLRQTAKFREIIARNNKKKLPWYCMADYAQRLSQEYLRLHEDALHSFIFAFGETMVYPLALDAGLVVKLYSNFHWLGYRKKPFNIYYNMSVADPKHTYFIHIKE